MTFEEFHRKLFHSLFKSRAVSSKTARRSRFSHHAESSISVAYCVGASEIVRLCTWYTQMHLVSWCIQLFRERLSYKRGKTNATRSKVFMGNDDFTVALLKLKVFQRGGKKQHKHVYSKFLLSSC